MALTGAHDTRRAGSLRPAELAHAAVMAALCAATAIIAVVVPFAAGLSLLGTVPMGLLAYRYRLRVLLAATVAGAVIAFLIAGMGGAMTVINCAYIGGLTGIVKRRGRGTPTVAVASVVAGLAFGIAMAGALAVLVRLRTLIFETMTANVTGTARILERIPGLEPFAQRMRDDFATLLSYWPLLIIASGIASITFVSLVGWWALSRVLSRLFGVPDVHKLDAPDPSEPPADPVPARLRDVRFRYPGTDHDAFGPASLDVEAGEHLAITGANGSGKTTLMLMLAGRQPTAGTIDRPGGVGWAASAAPRSSCNIRRARCSAPGWRTTWCGDCPRARTSTSIGCWTRSVSKDSPNGTPADSRAVNSSASRWQARWPANRSS